MMNERLRESLSALMDNEADELEIERVLARVGENEELRAVWLRYNMARNSLQGHCWSHREWDISERVRTAVEAPGKGRAAAAGANLRQRIQRPLTSLAVAASVTATVVFGGWQLAQVGDGDGYQVARPVTPIPLNAGFVNVQGAMPVYANYGMQDLPVLQPATRNAYDELAQRRLVRYMQEHAEQAALNSPQGLLPFARVPEIRE